MNRPPAPELSRPWRADSIGLSPQGFAFEADAGERRALARRFGLRSVDSLSARGRLRRIENTVVELEAQFEARVVQTCVISLEPVPAELAETFVVRYAEGVVDDGGDLDIDPDAEDPPDPIVDGVIDVGEAVAEHMALALDPYPRADAARMPEHGAGDDGDDNPFASLRKLRDGT